LQDKNKIILIVLKGTIPVGVVRFDIEQENQVAEININIAPRKRGKGIGSSSIKIGCQYVFHQLKLTKIIAKIKKENISSIKAFSKVGFSMLKANNCTIIMKLIK